MTFLIVDSPVSMCSTGRSDLLPNTKIGTIQVIHDLVTHLPTNLSFQGTSYDPDQSQERILRRSCRIQFCRCYLGWNTKFHVWARYSSILDFYRNRNDHKGRWFCSCLYQYISALVLFCPHPYLSQVSPCILSVSWKTID